ncbi:protein DpdF [Micromonospora chokoriensis]|uniref:Helicase conserved C-terminal domain-containing protein n=1 Tax=Micromonospora chokoriensis TaxID=356851 RepID=A0A1C4UQC2_9ACTN|nr:protein DpdF [Micromonospora chokoriensis]SCE73834.1 Helicase conserved C-terminal domain-containing protein [Micromonospora chokoriensis]
MSDAWADAQALWSLWPDPEAAHPTDATVTRLRDALSGLANGETGWRDAAALTRQILLEQQARRHGSWPLEVPIGPALPGREQWEQAGCQALTTPAGLSLTAQAWHPPTPSGEANQAADQEMAEVYAGQAGTPPPHPADPFWTRTLGPRYQHYTSVGQREAARSIVTAPPGSCLIVCLPTGQGKTELAWAAAIPATRQRGVAVIVVPTIVLAMDMERRLRGLLAERGEHASPSGHYAYTGGLAADIKQAIRRDIRQGRQRVVIAAPEALLGGLNSALDTAARQGHLTHLIIDEAHLVEQWGNEFRPEFQAIAGQRRTWITLAPPGRAPVTLAMSATLTRQQIHTLQHLFGTAGLTELVWAAQTRREPSYFIDEYETEAARNAAVLHAVSALPRPMILYTTRKRDAQAWAQRLRDAGFRRLVVVTGDLDDTARRAAVMGWRGEDADGRPARTRYDIVVGTSAFGLGLDMANVRTVIHACVPETLDRYYQEVGRGGRDRRPAIAYLASAPSDYPLATRINREVVISADKGWDRWGSMRRSATNLGHGTYDIGLDTLPTYIPEESGHSRQWNVRTLNLMAQAKLIALETPQPPKRQTEEPEEQWQRRLDEYHERSDARVIAHVRDGRTNDHAFWQQTFEAQRRLVTTEQTAALAHLRQVIKGDRCVGEILSGYYRVPWCGGTLPTTINCRGCPACRRRTPSRAGGGYYRSAGEPLPGMVCWPNQPDPLEHLRGSTSWMSLWWRDNAIRDDLLPQLLTQLARRGVSVIVGPGASTELTVKVQHGAWPRPVIVDSDASLVDGYGGPLIWISDERPSLPLEVRTRLAAGAPTYLVHPRELPDPERPHLRLCQTCDVSLPITTALGAL